ncbi:MAG TPA: GTP diphosphokinase [Moraxellaceae bacterium]|nr:GTP diphosphokinase [Moraxellaceae bacterium]
MVKVREDYPCTPDGQVDLDAWLARLEARVELHDVAELKRACEFAERVDRESTARENAWSARTSSFLTGLAMADILADLKLDQESLIAAVLYRAVREGKTTQAVIEKAFGADIAHLIDGVLRMAAISQIINPAHKIQFGQSQQQLDNVRKMLVAMIDDVRVALIKLAERTFAIREVKDASPERRHRVAREIFDIYAPLAHRLGIGHIKWELEDLSFRYLEPEAYKHIAQLLDEKRLQRDEYIQNVIRTVKEMLSRMGMRADVTGRAKHIYSIWRKMQRKKISFNEVYDVRAVRILVPEIRDCYAALGVVHSLWKHIPREFDDYIATPKENGYRSLHTAVIGPQGKPLEVQIRTFEMHEEAELGVCAHWVYKEGAQAAKGMGKDAGYESKIAWLRQVLEWQEDMGDSQLEDFAEQLNHAIHDERIYVFTRDGHVIDMPSGATPLDFAYHVHTEIGHSCRGAKVNGRIVPLSYKLQTGEQVEIMTAKGGAPSRDWLSASLGFLNTSRAQAKVRHWFKMQDRDKNVAEGREQLERELARLAVTLDRSEIDQLAARLNVRSGEDVMAGIGAGDIRISQVIQLLGRNVAQGLQQELLPQEVVHRSRHQAGGSPVIIEGVGNLLTHMAGCCQPVPGEPIVGYVTQGRGVSVHSRGCPEFLRLQSEEPERVVDVQWNQSERDVYPVDIHIRAWDRTGLLRDITGVLANEHVNVTGVQTRSDKNDGTASMLITVEVASLDALGRLLAKIEQQPNVIEARRSGG